jgi:hypothetical protein
MTLRKSTKADWLPPDMEGEITTLEAELAYANAPLEHRMVRCARFEAMAWMYAVRRAKV